MFLRLFTQDCTILAFSACLSVTSYWTLSRRTTTYAVYVILIAANILHPLRCHTGYL